MGRGNILIADDDAAIRTVVNQALARAGYSARATSNASTLWNWVAQGEGDVVITDVIMPDENAFDMIPRIKKIRPDLPIIVMSAQNTFMTAITAAERGAYEYLPKPFDLKELVAVVGRALREPKHNKSALAADGESENLPLIGRSASMQDVYRVMARLMHTDLTVLITGESGTGKELVARALHDYGQRRKGPFIAINMAAIPRELIESELFGHEKGAFTGAASQRQGRFQQADGGTLFLDEIGDMPAETQTRLLRVLADGEFYRVGGHTPVKVDVRIIAATHQNLESLVEGNRFREDLFHRLNVIRIHIPKLSDRREDIPKLAQHFFHKAANELGVEPKVLLPETENYLCSLDWPGNVRQLENTCRWITVMASGREVLVQDLPPELMEGKNSSAPAGDWEKALRHWADQALARGQQDILSQAVPTFERALIETALKHTAGRKRDAANLLGWGRNTLTRKLKDLGMAENADD